MGKIRNIVKSDMNKVFTCAAFWCAVLAVTVIELLGSAALDINKVSHSVIDIAVNSSKSEYMAAFIDEVSVRAIIFRGTGSYLWMFAPVLAGLPLVPLLCAERKNKAMRYELYRTTKNRFVVSKLISACLSGGMVMMLGYGLFCIAVYILIPFKGMSGNVIPEYMEITAEINPFVASAYLKYGFGIIVVMKLVLFFAYGAVSAILAYALTSFITNKYLVLCMPYIINYMLCMFAQRQSMKEAFWTKPQTYIDAVFGLQQSTFTTLYNCRPSAMCTFLIMQLLLGVVCVVFYSVVMRKRCDCGQ